MKDQDTLVNEGEEKQKWVSSRLLEFKVELVIHLMTDMLLEIHVKENTLRYSITCEVMK